MPGLQRTPNFREFYPNPEFATILLSCDSLKNYKEKGYAWFAKNTKF
jgi:hypothetical protein